MLSQLGGQPVLPRLCSRRACWVQNLSFLFVAATTAGAVLVGQGLQVIPSVLFSTYLAWFYLRYLQQHSGALGR